MLTICRSPGLHKMADRLLQKFHSEPLQNLLSPEFLIVQNHGMARWLSLYMAEKEGIAANLQFKFPAELFWQMIRLMNPSLPETLPSERGPMTWALMQILKDDSDPVLIMLRQYINADDPLKKEMRCWQLARRIADVFDQYLTYRSQMLLNWQDYELLMNKTSSERWQAVLWKKLKRQGRRQPAFQYEDRAALQRNLLKAINAKNLDFGRIPQRITVFGVSSMPPLYLEILVQLSKLTDISIYSSSGEMDENHPLVKSMGTAGNEFQMLLSQFVDQDDAINTEIVEIGSDQKDEPTSLLQKLQHDLRHHYTEMVPSDCDGTIQIHSCHSRRREIEVLYDQILRMLDKDETLNPSDIRVLAPDIEPYMAEIEGVFGTTEEGLPEIPYHFSERSAQVDMVKEAFVKLMRLAESRFTVADVIDFLHYKPIREKFSLSDDDLNTLQTWIADNNIRWGIDSAHKRALNLPDTDHFTWQSGLDRIMLGYAMNPQDDALYHHIYPYEEIEGTEKADLAGRFSNFLHSLFKCYRTAQKACSLKEWSTVLGGWLSTFFGEGDEDFPNIQFLRDCIFKLKTDAALVGFKGKVSFQIIRSSLTENLQITGTGGGRSGRGVAFSSLIPMRNIPSRIICVLGMNDDTFPRLEHPVSFDLMKQDPQPGDRLHSREDRQIFLEIILAARETLYFSYVGKSNRQDADFPPSVILRELIDYLMDTFGLNERKLVTEHHLQAFSPAYFTKDKEAMVFSYSSKNREIAHQLASSQLEKFVFLKDALPEPGPLYKQLSVDQLTAFFCHPAKYLLQNRLGVYFYGDAILEEDRESFNLGGLERYYLDQQLLDRYLNGKSLQAYKKVAFSKSMLPDGWPGEQAFEHQKTEVKKFGNNLEILLSQKKLDPFEVEIKIDDFTVVGRLKQIYEKEQAFFRFGSMKAKDLITLWIQHLAFQTVKPQDHSGISRLYTPDDKQPLAVYQFAPVANPVPIVHKLLDIYWSGLQENILFFPNTSYAFANEIINKEHDEEKALKKASWQWKNDYKTYGLEGKDIYNKCLIGQENPLEDNRLKDKFKQISISFWEPLFAALKDENQ